MRCFSPLSAWQRDDGVIVFSDSGGRWRPLELPCGQCIGCRLRRSCGWAIRCVHESRMHPFSSFITLTYDLEHVPKDGCLRYSDFQLFMRALRKRVSRVKDHGICFSGQPRFYMCGEYGELGRPHFHAILFGVHFSDRVKFTERDGVVVYRSDSLARIWKKGFCTVGEMTFESAAYIARYCMKKVTGDKADEHYKRVSEDGEVYWLVPEFNRMSLKPGIGAKFFEKYKSEMYPRDYAVVRGVKYKPPRRYDEYLNKLDGSMLEEVKLARFENALKFAYENSPARLAVHEECAKARIRFKIRTLE